MEKKYYILKVGDMIKAGDEFLQFSLPDVWKPIYGDRIGTLYQRGLKTFRRPIKKLRIG